MATQPVNKSTEREQFVASLTPEELEEFLDYEAMAADEEREKEAYEWTEGLIGDVG